jgi:hypothetical protein
MSDAVHTLSCIEVRFDNVDVLTVMQLGWAV